jgi:hypothetical protein
MNIESQDRPEIRTEPTMFADTPRQKPNGKVDPLVKLVGFCSVNAKSAD